ncbi:MAG: copper-binding protein [Acidobacteriota bacterium]
MRGALVLLALGGLIACAGPAPPPPPDHVYEVRGLVRQLPDPSQPGSEFFVTHESVPDFVDLSGEVVGMGVMTMPFQVASPSLLDGVEVGDKIVFTLETRDAASPPVQISRIEVLADDTALALETPGADEAMDHGAMDHGDMDHGAMDHGDMDHGAMDHEAAGDDAEAGDGAATNADG